MSFCVAEPPIIIFTLDLVKDIVIASFKQESTMFLINQEEMI